MVDGGDRYISKWSPSIHMPQWVCRIELEIVSTRVERLNDCSGPDALAEGCSTKDMQHGDCLASVYSRFWESINGAGSWPANPYQTRHTYASRLLSAGENALYVATPMGHKGTAMINKHYGRWLEQGSEAETRQQAANFLAKVSPKSAMPKLKPA
jgi:hypothetical protein